MKISSRQRRCQELLGTEFGAYLNSRMNVSQKTFVFRIARSVRELPFRATCGIPKYSSRYSTHRKPVFLRRAISCSIATAELLLIRSPD